MPRAASALLVAPLLALAACATTSAVTSAATAPRTMTAPAHSSQAAARDAPATARMICSEDIKRKVEQALRLDAPPPTRDMWADGVYTCRYSLPMGVMTLSDQVFPDAGAARAHMMRAQAQDRGASPVPGLGQQAYATDRSAVVLKDNQILTVDTAGLPERFGAEDQRRSDLAYEVASDVLGCWTGDE